MINTTLQTLLMTEIVALLGIIAVITLVYLWRSTHQIRDGATVFWSTVGTIIGLFLLIVLSEHWSKVTTMIVGALTLVCLLMIVIWVWAKSEMLRSPTIKS